MSRRAEFVLLLALFAAGCHPHIDPQQPSIPVVDPPAPPPSTIQVPVSVPLERLRQVMEASLPTHLEEAPYNHLIDGGPDHPRCGYGIGYSVDRHPLGLTGSGNTVDTSVLISYWVKGRKRLPCPGPLVYGSCGTNGEPPRRIATGVTTVLGIRRDWTANVQSTPKPIQALEPCQVTFFNINITDRIVGFFGNRFAEMVNRLNERASAEIRLSERAQAAWSAMQKPILVGALPDAAVRAAAGRADTGIWLVVAPEHAGYFPIRATNAEITAGAQLHARPRLVIGDKPDPTMTPLPDATEVPSGNAFFVSMPIDVGYAPINRALRDALNLDNGGTSFPPAGSKRITITNAELFAYGAQAVLRLDFRGSARGQVYLTGTPTFNSYLNTLTFPDLEYTLETTQALVKIIDWFKHDEFRDYLRGRLAFDVTEPVAAARKQLQDALNSETPDVRLTGSVASLTPLAVFADPKRGQFRAIVQAAGTLSVTVK